MELTIGCTTRPYSALTYEQAFERIALAGYSDVAVFANQGKVPVRADSTPAAVGGVRDAASEAGLRPSMVIGGTKIDQGVDAAVDDYKRLIDNVARVGAEWLLDCGTGATDRFSDYCDVMRLTAPHAQAAGIRITLKPHGGITLTSRDLLRAAQEVDHDAFTLCYDPGNIIYYTKGDTRPETDITAVADRLDACIIKDCILRDGKPDVMVTAGDGLVDFSAVLRQITGKGFRGPLYVECVGSPEGAAVDRDVAFTLGYVRGILAGL